MVPPFEQTAIWKVGNRHPHPVWAERLTPQCGFVKPLIERPCEYRPEGAEGCLDLRGTKQYRSGCVGERVAPVRIRNFGFFDFELWGGVSLLREKH
jgi:hypothetical protein